MTDNKKSQHWIHRNQFNINRCHLYKSTVFETHIQKNFILTNFLFQYHWQMSIISLCTKKETFWHTKVYLHINTHTHIHSRVKMLHDTFQYWIFNFTLNPAWMNRFSLTKQCVFLKSLNHLQWFIYDLCCFHWWASWNKLSHI